MLPLAKAQAEILACPRCHGSLRTAPGVFECLNCSASYPIEDGIPVFTIDGPGAQEPERRFRDAVARRHRACDAASLMRAVGAHHCVEVMQRRAQRWLSHFRPGDWVLDIGTGWAWPWRHAVDGPAVLGIDFCLENLRVARRLLSDDASVMLVCADASALPVRRNSLAGFWSVQAFQHMPAAVADHAQGQLGHAVRAEYLGEIYNLNPTLMGRAIDHAGRHLGRREYMELTRLGRRELMTQWRSFGRGDGSVAVGYSELFFHPDVQIRPRPYPTTLETVITRCMPSLAAFIARQIHVRVAAGHWLRARPAGSARQ